MSKVDWSRVGAKPWLGEQPYTKKPASNPVPVARDFSVLERRWALAQKALELAGEYGRVPEAEYIYSLHIDVLKKRIKQYWLALDSELAVGACLQLVTKMHDDPPAALLGYAILVTGLLEADCHVQAERVADQQAAYRGHLETTGYWQVDAADAAAAGGPEAEAGRPPS